MYKKTIPLVIFTLMISAGLTQAGDKPEITFASKIVPGLAGLSWENIPAKTEVKIYRKTHGGEWKLLAKQTGKDFFYNPSKQEVRYKLEYSMGNRALSLYSPVLGKGETLLGNGNMSWNQVGDDGKALFPWRTVDKEIHLSKYIKLSVKEVNGPDGKQIKALEFSGASCWGRLRMATAWFPAIPQVTYDVSLLIRSKNDAPPVVAIQYDPLLNKARKYKPNYRAALNVPEKLENGWYRYHGQASLKSGKLRRFRLMLVTNSKPDANFCITDISIKSNLRQILKREYADSPEIAVAVSEIKKAIRTKKVPPQAIMEQITRLVALKQQTVSKENNRKIQQLWTGKGVTE